MADDDGVYDYWQPWPIEYDAFIGNGHRGSIREGEHVALNKLHTDVGAPTDGDILDFTATAIKNPSSPRKAILTIDVCQRMPGGAKTNQRSFTTGEQDFDSHGRAALDDSVLFNRRGT
jgi:hypothetical protein